MDRVTVYAGQIPLETDLLRTNKFAMMAVSKLAAAMLGTSTIVNGLACVPTGPASLTVNVNPGEIYSLANVDSTAYSSIAADTTHQILKQGILLDAVNLSCPAPGTAGQSINYLIQATYQDSDTDLTALPYYNASNPTQAWSGPNNSGTAQATTRKGIVTLSAKAGTAATTGSQTTPAPDAGYTGLWVVTVANGQTQITAPNIVQATNAPILSASLLAQIQACATLGQAQAMRGTYNGSLAFSASSTLTLAQIGAVVYFFGSTASQTLTLPPASSLSSGQGYTISNFSTVPVTVARTGGDTILAGSGVGSIVLQPGDDLEIAAANSSQWVAIGSAVRQFNPLVVAPATQSQHAAELGQLFPSISASVASNALTLSLSAPTALPFRNPSLTSGTPVVGSIAANLSLTVPSGATLGTTNGVAAQLALIVAYNAGSPVLCVANMAGGLNLDETTLISPTTISGAAASASTIYSASAVAANSPFRVVGYINISEAAAGTWATAPALVQGCGGQAMAAMQSLGYGQTWQTVSGSRTAGTTYYNTTSRPIAFSVQAQGTTSSAVSVTLTVNGITVMVQNVAAISGGFSSPSALAIVPPGQSYSATIVGGTASAWTELR